MDPDQIEPSCSGELIDPNFPRTTRGDLSAPMPGGRALTSRARDQGPEGASNVVTAIAAAIINSSMITHSIIITVIVTISVLTAALALECAARRTAKDLEDGFHGEAFSTACIAEATNRRLDVIRPIGGSRAVEREEAAGQATAAPTPIPRADFEAFWEHHYRHYLNVLMATGATKEDAHDTIHDVIVDMLEKKTLDGLRNPKAWIRKAVLHTYYDQQQRRRRGREIERNQTPESYVDDGPNVWEDWQWVEQILSTLPPTQRTVIELIIAEFDAREIADLLGKTPGTVRQNLAHARKRLRANLGKDYQIGPTTCPGPVLRKEETP